MNFWHRHQLRSQARDFLKAFRKQRVYNADLLPAAKREKAEAYEAGLAAALKAGEPLQPVLERGNVLAAELFPLRPGDVLRENVEVIFVAIVAALALRAFFLQPFKIPTDSMSRPFTGSTPTPSPSRFPRSRSGSSTASSSARPSARSSSTTR